MIPSFDDVIFPVHAVQAPGRPPRGAKALTVETADGATLHGLMVPPATKSGATPLLVLGFGGNAWNGQDVAAYLHDLYPAAHVACFHYRGYRPSSGRPSAEALVADAPLVLDAVRERVAPKRTVLVGFSIGSAVAAILAARAAVDGAILVTPFDSLHAVAGDAFPFVPIRLFMRQELAAAAALKDCDTPIAIVAAANDELIPRRRTDALRAAVPNLVFDATISGAGHNDLYVRSAFQQAMHEALDAVLAAD